MTCVKLMLRYKIKLWHLRFYHNEVPKKIFVSMGWKYLTTFVMTQIKTMMLKVGLSQWKNISCHIWNSCHNESSNYNIWSFITMKLTKKNLHFNWCKMCHIGNKKLVIREWIHICSDLLIMDKIWKKLLKLFLVWEWGL
jgi:hypothetical protein